MAQAAFPLHSVYQTGTLFFPGKRYSRHRTGPVPGPDTADPDMSIPPYTIEPASRFRTMTLAVSPSGLICVRVPLDYDPDEVRKFVRENILWIEKQRRIFSMPARPSAHSVMIGDLEVPYKITYQGARKRMVVGVHYDGRVEVRVPDDTSLESIVAYVERKKDWIRQMVIGEDRAPHADTRAVTWNGRVIPYTVRTSKRARHISIKVLADRSVEVVTPLTAGSADIERVVRERAEWIHTAVVSDARPLAVRRSFCDGETSPFLGGTVTVRVTRGMPGASFERVGEIISVRLPDGASRILEQTAIRKAVGYVLKDETRKYVTPIVARYATLFGVAAPTFEVRDAQRKWGTCVGGKRLLFTSRLCMLPTRLADYVVAHEVCHLLVMDHSERFWKNLARIMPDCRDRAVELRRASPLYTLLSARTG